MKNETKALIKALRAEGYTVELGKGGHWKVSGEGLRGATIVATASDYRSVLNDAHDLKRAGYVFTWRGKRYEMTK